MMTIKYSNRADFQQTIKGIKEKYDLRNTVIVKLKEVMIPFIGEKIIKVDGTFTKKFQEAVKPVLNETITWIKSGDYSISLYAFSQHIAFIASVQCGVLREFYNFEKCTTFELSDEELTRQVSAAENEVESLYNKIKQIESKFNHEFAFIK